MKFYLPVFGYKPSFDSDKGDKHKMEVHYIMWVDENGNIGDAIPQPRPRRAAATRANANDGDTANAVPVAPEPQIQNCLKTRMVEVRKCKTTAVDETLHTVDMFLIERKNSNMEWSEAIYNFSNCLGNTARLRLQKVKNARRGGYPNTQAGFELLIKHYIKELCLDDNVKGTLKQSIKKGEWIKPEEAEIANHKLRVQQLFSWMDQVPGYQNDNFSEQEKHQLYVLTFPTSWQTNIDVQKNVDNTSFNEINNYMRKQKDGADKKKKLKKKDKKKDNKKNLHKKGKGSGSNKYKLDPKATGGPRT